MGAAIKAFYEYINRATDHYFQTVKHLIRTRNKLRVKNKVDAASNLSERIDRMTIKGNTTSFDRVKRRSNEIWREVNQLLGGSCKETPHQECKVTAESLSQHFCTISTDANYASPSLNSTVVDGTVDLFTTYKLLKLVGSTATGPDGLAA